MTKVEKSFRKARRETFLTANQVGVWRKIFAEAEAKSPEAKQERQRIIKILVKAFWDRDRGEWDFVGIEAIYKSERDYFEKLLEPKR